MKYTTGQRAVTTMGNQMKSPFPSELMQAVSTKKKRQFLRCAIQNYCFNWNVRKGMMIVFNTCLKYCYFYNSCVGKK